MKNLLVALGVSSGIALAACGGRVVVDGVSSGAGGQGGQPGTTSVFSATASVTTGSFPTTTVSSSSKASSGGGCATCFDVLSGVATPGELCGVEAVGLFKNLNDCACGKICAKACANNFCISFNVTTASPECGNCLKDTSTGCGFELLNCANH